VIESQLVSILVPVYNREHIIAETIVSALAQTYNNIEVVVVDNASTDKTWDVIQSLVEKDARVKAFRNQTNLGPVRNWMRCVEEASGDYGKILWSDDLIAPDFLEKTLPLFKEDVGFVYSGVKIFIGDNPYSAKTSFLLGQTGLYPAQQYIHYALYEKGVPVSPGCAVFRMQDIRNNLWVDVPNKINSDFAMHAIGNDLLLFLLTANQYKQFGFVADPLSFFRAHEGSISVSSSTGKLPLHYALAKAYFVENYQLQESNCLAAQIQFMLWRFKDSAQFGMKSIDNFFVNPVRISKYCLLMNLFKKAIRLPKFIFKKIIKPKFR
jgi:glycosyltransferase involved in cell wall biosynthesis